MVITTASPKREQAVSTTGRPFGYKPCMVMASQRHSVLAKALRYRLEADRLLLVATELLTVGEEVQRHAHGREPPRA